MDEGRRAAWEAAIGKLRRREKVSPEDHCDLLREGMFVGEASPDVFEEADLFLDYWLHHLSIDCSAPGSLDTSLSHAAGLIEIAACHA